MWGGAERSWPLPHDLRSAEVWDVSHMIGWAPMHLRHSFPQRLPATETRTAIQQALEHTHASSRSDWSTLQQLQVHSVDTAERIWTSSSTHSPSWSSLWLWPLYLEVSRLFELFPIKSFREETEVKLISWHCRWTEFIVETPVNDYKMKITIIKQSMTIEIVRYNGIQPIMHNF